MERFLSRLGVPDRCYELLDTVIRTCEHCNAFKPVPRQPRFGAELAGHFGDVVVIDLLYIFNMQFMLIIDEATRWKICALCMRKDAASLGKCFLHTWLRYFGPPRVARSDQEGGIKSEEFVKLCDRFSIYRQLAGSGSKGEHTTTGSAESHIRLVKTAALKCEHQCKHQGLPIDQEDIVFECCMGQNFQLEYGGFTPAQAVLGHNPRGMYETATSSTLAHHGALETSPDYFESYIRLRNIARVCIQQAIIEARIAIASHPPPMKMDLSKLKPGSLVDLYRSPDRKDVSGWRGQCELLDISHAENTAIVKHQSIPYIVPLRHVRPHCAPVMHCFLAQSPVFLSGKYLN